MKRAAILWIAFALIACGPTREPTQASQPDPLGDEANKDTPSSSGNTASGGSSSKGGGGGDPLHAPPGGKPVKGEKGEAPVVGSLASYLEGLRWGMTHAEVTKVYTENGGVIWKDYDEKLAKARVGPEMTAIENEREQTKLAFGRSYIEFKDTPTGYDATGIKHEYTYKNKEALMWVNRKGKKRYFFFINDRLWKIYDEVPLDDVNKAYLDVVNRTNGQLAAQGRVHGADPKKEVWATTVDYKDNANHLRIVDRTTGNDKVVGVVIEDLSTINNLAALRPVKAEDPTAIDPSITAVTKGGLSDPNAPNPTASGSAGKKGAPPPPKKK